VEKTVCISYTPIAPALGFSTDDLLGFTRNAIRAAFISPQQRTALLAEVDTWDNAHRK